MSKLFQYIRALKIRTIGFVVRIYLRLLGCEVGKGLKCESFPIFKDIPKGNISIGSCVSIGKNFVLEIAHTGQLEIGNNVTIGDFNRMSSTHLIRIAEWVAIAEMVSIRGSFHQIAKGTEIVKQGNDGATIQIGRDVLLGAQAIVLGGVDIPNGVVIGAQSLVKKSDKLHSDGIFAGSPLKHLRDRA